MFILSGSFFLLRVGSESVYEAPRDQHHGDKVRAELPGKAFLSASGCTPAQGHLLLVAWAAVCTPVVTEPAAEAVARGQ